MELIVKLDSIQAGRKEMRPACRAICRAPIYNAMNYIKNVYVLKIGPLCQTPTLIKCLAQQSWTSRCLTVETEIQVAQDQRFDLRELSGEVLSGPG